MTSTNTFTIEDVLKVIDQLGDKIDFRLDQKGYKHLNSDLETLGILHQEFYEFNEAVHKKVSLDEKREELLDIAWAAILGVLRINKQISEEQH